MNQSALNRLREYHKLLLKWQKSVNLVAPSTLDAAWDRHFEDSLQLVPFLDGVETLADVGSGAGFPGLVLAVARPDIKVHLIESDGKKAAFLANVARETGAENVVVHHGRIENFLPALRADMVSARALASLTQLIEWTSSQWGRANSPARLLFPKGADWAREVAEAENRYNFDMQVQPSVTDNAGRILCISGVAPKGLA